MLITRRSLDTKKLSPGIAQCDLQNRHLNLMQDFIYVEISRAYKVLNKNNTHNQTLGNCISA